MFWPVGEAPSGSYTVSVEGFRLTRDDGSDCGGGDFTLTITVAGEERVETGTVGQDEAAEYTFDVPLTHDLASLTAHVRRERRQIGGSQRLGQQVGDAPAALAQVVVAEGERQPGVAGGVERLARHHRHLRLLQQDAAQLDRVGRPGRPGCRGPGRPTGWGRRRTRPGAP